MRLAALGLVTASLILSLGASAWADSTIAQWGEVGGDTTIVDASMDLGDKRSTYEVGVDASPTEAGYYPNRTGRSPVFNHASTTIHNTKRVFDDAEGDNITSAKNTAFYEAMFCWESFLTGDTALRSLTAELRTDKASAGSELRWVIQKLSGDWYCSEAIATSERWASYSTADPGGLTWYDFTPLDGGSATIGSEVDIHMVGVSIVGVYANFTNVAGNPWQALKLRYFQATGSEPPVSRLSYDTGYTIQQVRTGMLNGESVIVGASYEGTVLAMDYDGNTLWTNPLTGYMVRDLWCADLDNDGTDEVLAAVADGTVHCVKLSDGSAFWAQPFKANDVPMNAVCAVRTSATERIIACGGFDMNMYYLTAAGVLIDTVDSRTYSDQQPWGDSNVYLGRTIGKAHNANFLRPIPQDDGTDHLMMLGANNHMQVSGHLYEFEPGALLPFEDNSISGYSRGVGAMRIIDPENDGNHTVLIGSSELSGQKCLEFNRQTETFQQHALSGIGENGYRVTQPVTIPAGNSYKILMICGTHIVLLPPDFDEAQKETIAGTYAYNDMWQDPTNHRIILASSQSGGSAIHIFDTTAVGWEDEFSNLDPPGKIQSIKDNFATISAQLETFTAPVWERTPTTVTCTQAGPTVPLAQTLATTYNNPIFLDNIWGTKVEERSWRGNPAPIGIPNTSFENREDGRKDYVLTQAQVLTEAAAAYALPDASAGIAFWGGHGNDPYYYQPSTLRGYLDIAESRGEGQKTVFVWPESSHSSTEFGEVLEHLYYPLADHDTAGRSKIFYRAKDIFWQSGIYKPAWQRLISGEYKHAFVPALEETSDKSMELSLAGRLGVWASGVVDDWGMRCSRDNPSFDRSRQHSYQRLPNHFLRNMVHNLAYGVTYMNNTYVDLNHMGLAWQLVAKGALFVPKRNEIVSFSPVHVSITDPDERYMKEGHTTKFSTNYDAAEEAANPMVFGRLNSTWLAAKNTDWDFSRYAAGVKERRQNFIPPYPNGMVCITPVQEGLHAANADYRHSMSDNLHPLYRNILKEHITNGHDYIASDSATQYAANSSYHQAVVADIQAGAQQIPVTVSGGVAWVCAQSAPTHLRLTLVDSGYLNPTAMTATVTFNTVTPVKLTDVMTGSTISMTTAHTATIEVPLGLFRFVDIELSEPFFPENDWGDFASTHGLTGASTKDSDGDGVKDLHEFAFGGDPMDAEQPGEAPSFSYDPETKKARFFSVESDSASAGIGYHAQWTDDLVNGPWYDTWTDERSSFSIHSGFEAIERTLDTTGKDQVFFRMEVKQL